ncbi:hypothetical protein [Thiomicrorhabdus sp.]|uniref:Flp family type IVb pilin n=1 Tax=Thiomicrorhabdus sp. TaxID=2039724 RepID=UPI0029C996CD|nr:hypothetical protein [Thiomicrorhabdus sp.]
MDKRRQRAKGATTLEYALMLAGVVIVAFILFGDGGNGVLGTAIKETFNRAFNTISTS